MNCRWILLLTALLAVVLTPSARAEEPATAPTSQPATPPPPPPPPLTIAKIIARIPVLKNDASGRFPLIAIEPFRVDDNDKSWDEGKPFPPEMIQELKKRGLTQWIPPRDKYIPFALALQKEGADVIMMEGYAFNSPGGDVEASLHQLPADFKRDPEQPGQQPKFPCPLELEGWRLKAEELRTTFKKYKDAGVDVKAAWLDWEVEPYAGESEWKEAKACSRCRKEFPPGVLDDFERYHFFITLLRKDLFSAYFVAPILESYPSCSITNWHEVISSAEFPTPTWSGWSVVPPTGIGMFTAANPIAYGNTKWYDIHWKKHEEWPLDVAHMDRIYTEVMLGQISIHERNAMRMAPEKGSIPWVDRYCADNPDPKIPILSRPRYLEILRHCWLRGADAMQIFNPNWFPEKPELSDIVMQEIEDAQKVFDEMLAYKKFLDTGVTMNTETPTAEYDGPIWSGLRVGDESLVRTFTQAAQTVKVTIAPFGDKAPKVELDCPPEGATYLLTRQGEKIDAKKQ